MLEELLTYTDSVQRVTKEIERQLEPYKAERRTRRAKRGVWIARVGSAVFAVGALWWGAQSFLNREQTPYVSVEQVEKIAPTEAQPIVTTTTQQSPTPIGEPKKRAEYTSTRSNEDLWERATRLAQSRNLRDQKLALELYVTSYAQHPTEERDKIIMDLHDKLTFECIERHPLATSDYAPSCEDEDLEKWLGVHEKNKKKEKEMEWQTIKGEAEGACSANKEKRKVGDVKIERLPPERPFVDSERWEFGTGQFIKSVGKDRRLQILQKEDTQGEYDSNGKVSGTGTTGVYLVDPKRETIRPLWECGYYHGHGVSGVYSGDEKKVILLVDTSEYDMMHTNVGRSQPQDPLRALYFIDLEQGTRKSITDTSLSGFEYVEIPLLTPDAEKVIIRGSRNKTLRDGEKVQCGEIKVMDMTDNMIKTIFGGTGRYRRDEINLLNDGKIVMIKAKEGEIRVNLD